jgi:uncharacterized membrane protein YidH (DUF202 family)
LAEERTQLAEFRTGLAILLVVPAASTIIAVLGSFLEGTLALISNVFSFGLFASLVVLGIWTVGRSRSRLNRIRKDKNRLKARECEFVSKSKTIHDLVSECVILDDIDKEG